MKCIATAGPTYEPLDRVRRLTNLSTGRLGIELAAFLVRRGHEVTLLLGEGATWRGERPACEVRAFTTTESLSTALEKLSGPYDAVFHAAAVSDFKFGQTYRRTPNGELIKDSSGKLETAGGPVLAELLPTPKIIGKLRGWFPSAFIAGWKYEVDGTRDDVLAKARRQIEQNKTQGCVANGPGYGLGFGIVTPQDDPLHCRGLEELCERLALLMEAHH